MQPAPRHTPPDPPPLSQTLRDAINASNTRAQEGQRVFGPISALWDGYVDSDEVRQLPAKLRKPLLALCHEMSRIATDHFDAYLKGQRAPQSPHTPQSPASTQPGSDTDATDNRPIVQALPPNPTPTYAQIAAQAPPPRVRKAPAKVPTKPRPDSRLFVRIGPEHKARKAGPFAMLIALKGLLGANSTLIQEVQEVPTGLALCTRSPEALSKLEEYTKAIEAYIGDCIIQKQSPWTTYRLTNIPRTINLLDGLGQITNNIVTDTIIADAIRELTSQPAVRVVEAKESAERGLYNSTWIISFITANHTLLPRTLRILGATATTSMFKPKPKTAQCSKCYKWHNARTCILPQHCRICGATKHQEDTHSTRCIAPSPHTCPARCLHCGGPHPADHPHCPLRPTTRGPKTKSERTAILVTSKLARVRALAAAKCQSAYTQTAGEGSQDPLQMDTASPPRTPTRNPSQTSATTVFRSRPPFTDLSQAQPISPVPFNA